MCGLRSQGWPRGHFSPCDQLGRGSEPRSNCEGARPTCTTYACTCTHYSCTAARSVRGSARGDRHRDTAARRSSPEQSPLPSHRTASRATRWHTGPIYTSKPRAPRPGGSTVSQLVRSGRLPRLALVRWSTAPSGRPLRSPRRAGRRGAGGARPRRGRSRRHR